MQQTQEQLPEKDGTVDKRFNLVSQIGASFILSC